MKIRVKAKEKNGLVDAKLLIKHPMETGRRKDKDGNLIPAKHLTTITIDYKGHDGKQNNNCQNSNSSDSDRLFTFHNSCNYSF
jgi:sulfur-oxidizing protein SoxZ